MKPMDAETLRLWRCILNMETASSTLALNARNRNDKKSARYYGMLARHYFARRSELVDKHCTGWSFYYDR